MIFKIKPLSINKAWYGKHIKTQDYKIYEIELSALIKKQKMPKYKGRIVLDIEVYYKNNASDIDNFLKPLLDILVKNKIIEDDKYIEELHVYKMINKIEGFKIEINKNKDVKNKE